MISASRLLRSVEPRVVTRISGQYAGQFLECSAVAIVPDLEGPVEQPDPYQFGLVGDGFHDDREPLQGDDYAEVVHRFKVLVGGGFLIGLLVVIASLLVAVGRG